MRLNRTGRIVERCWSAIPRHSTSADLDAYVIMPNHLHGILWFAGAGYIRPLPVVIGTFKLRFHEQSDIRSGNAATTNGSSAMNVSWR
jgi:hypothetical protein